MDSKIYKAQFNVSLFSKQVHIILNQKFVDLLKNFIVNLNEDQRDEWLDVIDAFAEANANKYYRSYTEYVITEFNETYTVSMELEMAEQLSKLILTEATHVSKICSDFDLNVAIAFARKLETAALGDYESLQAPKRQLNFIPQPVYMQHHMYPKMVAYPRRIRSN